MIYRKKRDAAYLEQLTRFLSEMYEMDIHAIVEAARGFYGETWRIDTAEGPYFVKIIFFSTLRHRYAESFSAIECMARHGIDFISKPVYTRRGEPYCEFRDGVVGVFEYVEGEHTEEYPLEELFRRLAKIYLVPTDKLTVKTEKFTDEYRDLVEGCLRQMEITENPQAEAVVALFQQHTGMLRKYGEALTAAAAENAMETDGFFITNGDAGGNVIINRDRFVIIDWDNILLAPMERDVWMFMHDEAQLETLRRSLEEVGVGARPRNKRLIYYAYKSYFYYLYEYLHAFLEFEDEEMRRDILGDLREYLSPRHWVNQNLRRAEEMAGGE